MTAPPRPPRRRPAAGPAPTEAALREAALAHLGRFAATEAGLRRVLLRRIDRWGQRALAEGTAAEAIAGPLRAAKALVPQIAAGLVAAGAVDDAGFAAARARRLGRAGRSRRAIAAHLAAKGVDEATAAAALPEDPAAELLAALAYCRRRRFGPFATAAPDEARAEARAKWLASLARAGFAHGTASAALAMPPEEAADQVLAARRD